MLFSYLVMAFNYFFEVSVTHILKWDDHLELVENIVDLLQVCVVIVLGSNIYEKGFESFAEITLSVTFAIILLKVGQTAYWHRSNKHENQVLKLTLRDTKKEFDETLQKDGIRDYNKSVLWVLVIQTLTFYSKYRGTSNEKIILYLLLTLSLHLLLEIIKYVLVRVLAKISIHISSKVVDSYALFFTEMAKSVRRHIQIAIWNALKHSQLIGGLSRFVSRSQRTTNTTSTKKEDQISGLFSYLLF